VFIVQGGVVHTPQRGVLEGISRRTAIELCQRLNIPLRIASLPAADVRHADEVFLTSTGGGVLPIAKVDGQLLKQFPGPITTRLRDAYWAMREEPAYSDPVDYLD